MNNDTVSISTLEDGGSPPETRIANANQARQIFEMMWRADEARARKRQLVKGLVDGNPPYRQADLRAAGQDYRANVNWRQAESYFNGAVGAFYDLFAEAPTYAAVRLNAGNLEEQNQWSRSVTTHFDWLCRFEPCFDYHTQISQDEMVLYGSGPLVFQDELDWRPISLLCNQLKVPERTKSDTSLWEMASLEIDYLPDELFKFILYPQEAKQRGWNVERVKHAIINAHPDTTKGGIHRTWEWHQQQLKNGSLYYSTVSKTISTAHLLFREFTKQGDAEGKISHIIIIRDFADDKPDVFMFQSIGRFKNWAECVHPMYYDRGGGGFHHSVTGMGVKMYAPMEYQNRLLCNLADKAFTPKVMFKPTTSTSAEEFSLEQRGDHLLVSEGFDVVQTPIAGVMEEGTIFNREITNLISSNLSQYRSNSTQPIRGNPRTAHEVQLDASKEASLQKTQMNRYYQQEDGLYSEMYRRAIQKDISATSPGGARAKEFVERCLRDGVPREALAKVEYVKASRVVGQGSEFLRQQSTEFLFGTVLPMLPETGRAHLVQDVIASRAGQSAVERYYPIKTASKLPDDQTAWATSQVADMKIGVPAVATASQNPAIFATVFIKSADDAASTLGQGGNPTDVASFLDLCGQAIAVHLQRMSGDKSRKALVKQIGDEWQKLAKLHDQLVQHIQQQQQEQKAHADQLQQQAASQNGELALAKSRQDGELELKRQKTAFGIQDKAVKTRQSMSLSDAKTAHQIRLDTLRHAHDTAMAEAEAEHGRRMDMMMKPKNGGTK